jgi:2-amino-4-hydroxy-6-hydroxymethyldihydropteridine diphosphokinase
MLKYLLPLHKNRTMPLVYLGLGTNLGNKPLNLNNAVTALSVVAGSVLSVSTYYASAPWGFESENEFLNAAVLVETNLSPFELLAKTQEIERNMGRNTKTTSGYEDRTIDIDILVYDKLIINQPSLKIPHPLIVKRDFVRIPLLEIAPELVDPISNKKFRLL